MFGEKIKLIRKEKNLSQIEMAEVLETSQSNLSRIEGGIQIPTADMLFYLKNKLNISIDAFLTDDASALHEHIVITDKIIEIPVLHEDMLSITIEKKWVENTLTKNYEHLCALYAQGDMMTPTINHGDMVIINTQKNTLETEGLFYILINKKQVIRRVLFQSGEKIKLIADNPCAKEHAEILSQKELHKIKVIGKVIWCGRKVY